MQHRRELLDQFLGRTKLRIGFAQASQIVFLPLQTLLFLKGDPMGHLQSGGRPLFLPFIGIDPSLGCRRNLFETASLPFEGTPGGDKAPNGGSGACISLSFNLPIQELSIPAALVPSADEMLL